MFRQILCFCLCPLPLVLLLGTPSTLHSPFRYLYMFDKIWNFFSPSSAGFSALALSAFPHRIPSSSLWSCMRFSPIWSYHSCKGEPSTGHSVHQRWAKKEDHFPQPTGNASPNAAQDTAGLFLPQGHIMFSPRSFSAKPLSSCVASCMYSFIVLLTTKCFTKMKITKRIPIPSSAIFFTSDRLQSSQLSQERHSFVLCYHAIMQRYFYTIYIHICLSHTNAFLLL